LSSARDIFSPGVPFSTSNIEIDWEARDSGAVLAATQ